MSLLGTTEDGILLGCFPNIGESYEDFFPRCVSEYMAVGKVQSEAEGICATTWQGHEDKAGGSPPAVVITNPGETKEQYMDRCVSYYLGQAPTPRFINYICNREYNPEDA